MVMTTRIKEYRAINNLTQDALASMVGVRRETIVHLENGKYNPSLKLAHDIAKALNTTIDTLLFLPRNSYSVKGGTHVRVQIRKPNEDYHDVIEEHARNGWRLVQIFAPAISGYGAAKFYELIFEKRTM